MKNLLFAWKQILPLTFSYIFMGIAFGVLTYETGYSVIWTTTASLLIYAGSMQIVLLSLMASGVPIYMIAIMTFFINARHMFYGIGFIESFKKMGWKYPYMALTMTDETFSVLCSVKYPDGTSPEKVNFYVAASAHILWVVSCLIGGLFGKLIPFDITGIDFTCTAFFITVCVNQWRQLKSHIPAITGCISAIVFYIFIGPDNFILPALSVSLIVLIVMRDIIILRMGSVTDGK